MNNRAKSASPHGHVLILVENLPLPFDRRVWLEATTLHEAGYRVSAICPKGERGQDDSFSLLGGIRIYRYPLPATSHGILGYFREYAAALVWSLWLAGRVWREERFDVVHACNPPDLLFLVALPFKLIWGTKFIFDQHDLSPETLAVKFHGRFRGLKVLMRVLERLTYQLADVVIATNESIREIARSRGHVSDRRLVVVRTGPDLKRLRPEPPSVSLKSGRQFLVVYVGVMGVQDGVDVALAAVRHIVLELGRNDITFAFLGRGEETEALRHLARQLGVDGFVEFTGRVPDSVLVRYLSTADVCITPDPANGLNEYHTMNKTMEYMAMGKPQVAFSLAETRFSAQDAALYAQPNDPSDFGDRILELLDDPNLRARLGTRGLQRIRAELSWDYSRRSLLEAYSRLSQTN